MTDTVDICSDKTGTLTQGRMVAKRAWIPSKGTYSVGTSSDPYDPTVGDLSHNECAPNEIEVKTETMEQDGSGTSYEDLLKGNPQLQDYFTVASLANLAHVHETGEGWKARGDPTEIAIQVFASRFNWNRERLTKEESWRHVAEFPFDSEVKKMSVIFENKSLDKRMVFTKGAVERVIASCNLVRWEEGSGPTEITGERRDRILDNMEALAAQGLRVLALASREYSSDIGGSDAEYDRADIEKDLTFEGLIGLYHPPRVESAGAVEPVPPSRRRCPYADWRPSRYCKGYCSSSWYYSIKFTGCGKGCRRCNGDDSKCL